MSILIFKYFNIFNATLTDAHLLMLFSERWHLNHCFQGGDNHEEEEGNNGSHWQVASSPLSVPKGSLEGESSFLTLVPSSTWNLFMFS